MPAAQGAALGVAIPGATRAGADRSGVTEGLRGRAPDDVVAVVGESLGAFAQITSALPNALADSIAVVANQSFVDAIGDGLLVGIGFIALSIAIARLTEPFKMRPEQAELEVAEQNPGA